MSLRPILIAVSSFVVLVGSALAGSPAISPFGVSVDLSYDTTLSTGGATARVLAARAADAFNVRDFGAVGNGTSHAIGTTYGATLAALASYTTTAGIKPFAWATNPIYGLTFTLSTSAAQGSPGTSLNFVSPITVGGATLSLASWIIPANGQDLLQTGMQVSGSCIAAGTTVSSFATATQTYSAGGTKPNTMAVPTGVITLSQATGSACASGTAITFTISPTQLAALTQDWLGMQAAIAAAKSASGGTVWVPAGVYYKTRPVVVPTTATQGADQVEVKGDGVWNTQIYDTVDTGPFSCSVGEMSRGPGSTGHFMLHDIQFHGPGTANTVGNAVAGMDGVCLGAKGETLRVSAEGYHAGVGILEDHQKVTDTEVNNNFYGIYMQPNGDVYGNQVLQYGSGAGDAWSSVGVAWNNAIESARFLGFTAGYSPYGFYRELPPTGNTIGLPFMAASLFDADYVEGCGNGWIYDENNVASIEGNQFIGILPDISGGSAFQIPGRGMPAIIYTRGDVFNNHFISTDPGYNANPSLVSDGLIEALVEIQANQFDNITNSILNNTKPILVSKSGTVIFNFFTIDRAQGEFRRAEVSLTSGQLVAHGVDGLMNSTRLMAAGYVPLGVVAQGQTAGAIVPVVTHGIVPATKTTDVAIGNAVPVCSSVSTPSSITACTNSPAGAPIGVDEDFGQSASATSAGIYVQIGPQPTIATTSGPGISYPDGTTITVNGAGKISAVSAVIGTVSYNPASDEGYACNGHNTSITADVDATNLQVSFVAPPSGNVIVVLNAMVTSYVSGWQVFWSVGFASAAGGASASDVAGTLGLITTVNSDLRVTHAVRLTSLTAGTKYYLNWRQSTNQPSTQAGPFILVGQSSTPYGPATMTVYSD